MENHVHERSVGVNQLEGNHRDSAEDDPRIGKEADGEHGASEAATVEHVENLGHDEYVHRHRAGFFQARAKAPLVAEKPVAAR